MPRPAADPARELKILEQLETDPDTTQADLAETLGVAVGTVNFALQRLVKKGYVRARQLQRRRLQYILTPAGLALRTRLALESLNYGMRLYRETRAQTKQLLAEVQQRGYACVSIVGEGDLAEIAQLTCLEIGLLVVPQSTPQVPTLYAQLPRFTLSWPLES